MKNLVLTIAMITAQTVFATTDIWEGSGTLFDTKGNATGKYSLVVENTKRETEIQSKVTVTLPDGSLHKEQCVMKEASQAGWTSQCENGNGGATCFGDGLCISYVEDSDGKAYATTIIMDSPTDMRLFRTELKNGKAIRFFREKIHKK